MSSILAWVILVGGCMLAFGVVVTLIQTAVENRRAGRGDKVGQALLISAAIALGVGLVEYFVVWSWAMTEHISDKETVVKDFFKEKTGRVPDEVKLRPAESTKSGESDAYAGTARFGADEVWDVRVWHEHKKIKMEATPRAKKEGGR